METRQLDLFQDLAENESTIFKQAKICKKMVQDKYESCDLEVPEINGLFYKYAVLDIDISIDLVSDLKTIEEPSTPKVFIWQFTTAFKLILSKDDVEVIKTKYTDPKVIKPWYNAIYTAKNFSQSDFHSVASQNFCLQLIVKALSDNELINIIESKIGSKKLVILFNSALYPSKRTNFDDFLERDMTKTLDNLFTKLKSIQKDNWCYVGYFEDFLKKHDLLIDLDDNEFLKSEKDLLLINEGKKYSLQEIFNNDYLFLNNSGFITQKYNTHGWNKNSILPPCIFSNDFTKIDNNNLNAIILDKKREIYAYIKKELDFRFFRIDMLLPKRKFEDNIIKDIVTIIQKMSVL